MSAYIYHSTARNQLSSIFPFNKTKREVSIRYLNITGLFTIEIFWFVILTTLKTLCILTKIYKMTSFVLLFSQDCYVEVDKLIENIYKYVILEKCFFVNCQQSRYLDL